MSNALKDDQTFNTSILMRVRCQQKFLDLFQSEWVLMNNLDHKLAQNFDVSVLEVILGVLLQPI